MPEARNSIRATSSNDIGRERKGLCSALICPTTSVSPFSINEPFVNEIDGVKCQTYIDWFAITFALTMTGCPVLSLPCGFTENGLPVGIQIVGKPRQEGKLLAFAKSLEDQFNVSKFVPVKVF